jgi:hypothetical protein
VANSRGDNSGTSKARSTIRLYYTTGTNLRRN